MNLKSLFYLSVLILFCLSCKQKKNSTNDASDLTKYGMKINPTYELGGLAAGTTAPLFNKLTNLGDQFDLKKELEKNPVVVIFYRGYWCPLCHKHLSQFQEDLLQSKKQFSVVAITPEQFEFVEKTVEKDALTIPVIYDDDESIMKNYKVAFEVTEAYQKKIKTFKGQDIAENNGKENATLPVPATYIIRQDGKIIKTFYDPNYKTRASVTDILEHL